MRICCYGSLAIFIVKNERKVPKRISLCILSSGSIFLFTFWKKATRIQNILNHSVWHFSHTWDYKVSWWTKQHILILARIEYLESHYLHSCPTLISTEENTGCFLCQKADPIKKCSKSHSRCKGKLFCDKNCEMSFHKSEKTKVLNL